MDTQKIDRNRRSLLVMLAGAFSAPADQLLRLAKLPSLSADFNSKQMPIVGSFLKWFVQRSFTTKITDPNTRHPLNDLIEIDSEIEFMLGICRKANSGGNTSYRTFDPTSSLISILYRSTSWNPEQNGILSLEQLKHAKTNILQESSRLSALSDSELLEVFSSVKLSKKDLLDAADSIGCPVMRQIVTKPILMSFEQLGPAGYIRDMLSGLRVYGGEIANLQPENLSDIRQKFPDAFALISHIKESGFTQFPDGSRLAQLQQLSVAYNKAKRLFNSPKKFEELKSICDQISEQAENLGIKLPDSKDLNNARISRDYYSFRERLYDARDANVDFEKLSNSGLPNSFYLIYNYNQKAPIIQILEEKDRRALPVHVFFKPEVYESILSILSKTNQHSLFEKGSKLFRFDLVAGLSHEVSDRLKVQDGQTRVNQ